MSNEGTVQTARLLPGTPSEIYACFETPDRLARWWGPAGFSNVIHSFDFRPGGRWTFDMTGPDGARYPNTCEFTEISKPRRLVIRHLMPVHVFDLVIDLQPKVAGTELTWTMTFESAEECEKVRKYVIPANEQNLDRLTAELAAAQ